MLRLPAREESRREGIEVNEESHPSNRKTAASQPVITVKTGKSNTYGLEVEVQGNARIVYRPHNPVFPQTISAAEKRG